MPLDEQLVAYLALMADKSFKSCQEQYLNLCAVEVLEKSAVSVLPYDLQVISNIK